MPKKKQEERIEPIIKQIGMLEPGKPDDRKWIVANRYDGRKLKGPFDTEFDAFASLKGKGSAKAD